MEPRAVPVDLSQLASFGDPAFVREMVDLFLETASTNLVAIRAAVETADARGLTRTAHSLKGACLGMSAAAMGSLAAELEVVGRLGRLESAAALLASLEGAFADTESYLREAMLSPVE